MARSETFNKKDKEKKRLEHRKNKAEKMEARKAEGKKGNLEDMLAYVDENGNLSSTPPDPKKKRVVAAEDIEISVPKHVPLDPSELIRKGTITFFDDAKGFGFIKDSVNGDSVFVHMNNLADRVKMNDKVSFEVESGPRGLSAVNVKKI
jgi:cold shock CspA family protein